MSEMKVTKQLIVDPSSDVFEKLAQDKGIEVFMALFEKPSTASELSQRLNITRAKINYLLDILLREELIYLHAEKKNGSNVEKMYAANRETFQLLTGQGSSDAQKMQSVLYILDTMRNHLLHSIKQKGSAHLGMVHVKISKKRVEEFTERVKQLQAEFDQEVAEEGQDSAWHTMVLSLFQGPNF